MSSFSSEQAATEEDDQSNVTSVPPVAQTEASSHKPEDNNIVVVKDVCPQEVSSMFHWLVCVCVFFQLDQNPVLKTWFN